MTTDLDAIERRHRQEVRGVNCRECRVSWPCDASVLLSQLREARAERDEERERAEKAEADAQGLSAFFELSQDRVREARAEHRATIVKYRSLWAREKVLADRVIALNSQVASLTAIRERAEVVLNEATALDQALLAAVRLAARFILGAAPLKLKRDEIPPGALVGDAAPSPDYAVVVPTPGTLLAEEHPRPPYGSPERAAYDAEHGPAVYESGAAPSPERPPAFHKTARFWHDGVGAWINRVPAPKEATDG